MNVKDNPLTGPPPREVPLAHAPLVRVIAQVRFPIVAAVEGNEFIAPFQEAVRAEYPILRSRQRRSVTFNLQGTVQDSRATPLWQFHDSTGTWRITLALDSLALETRQYTNRDDFLARLRRVLETLGTHVNPKMIDRLGVRYIDRITGDTLNDLTKIVRPEVFGIASTQLAAHARHSISESVFDLADDAGQVMARWGLLPAGATVDPTAIEIITERSWILDIDASQTKMRPFDVDSTVEQARGFAARIYSVFRWVVNDEFLRRYGGQL